MRNLVAIWVRYIRYKECAYLIVCHCYVYGTYDIQTVHWLTDFKRSYLYPVAYTRVVKISLFQRYYTKTVYQMKVILMQSTPWSNNKTFLQLIHMHTLSDWVALLRNTPLLTYSYLRTDTWRVASSGDGRKVFEYKWAIFCWPYIRYYCKLVTRLFIVYI